MADLTFPTTVKAGAAAVSAIAIGGQAVAIVVTLKAVTPATVPPTTVSLQPNNGTTYFN